MSRQFVLKLKSTFVNCVYSLFGANSIDLQAQNSFNKMQSLLKRKGALNLLRARRIENQLQTKYLLKISSTAKIGANFQIRHPHGIHIGATTEIGNNCKVYPFFMCVAAVKDDDKRVGLRRHPKIGNDCILGARATVIGPIEIGDDVTIAACAVVSKDVPSHSVVKGINQIRPKRYEEIPETYKR